MTMPQQKPTTSRQDFETPPEFISAIEQRWGPLDVDLACYEHTKKAPIGITKEIDSLSLPWAELFFGQNLFLNPEFNDIPRWAEKCAIEGPLLGRGRIFFLTPASIGTNWFAEHVQNKAMVLGVSPRMKFVGEKDPYPKDLMLSIFTPGVFGFGSWRYKK